ncbi:OmpA family protein [Muricauda sp. SCSIO 64092]|uniref:OmpA family protein n=1 Tax=Allomuricauda sp. SCSIO 64092 TaxID=2908842 RepID=UPI001FF65925|nr:OmpA family protein [Muricauda sp. SCSIO 64092]UOY07491.1 OmpA family protein [Muricauda sp. SCSIO 64092]
MRSKPLFVITCVVLLATSFLTAQSVAQKKADIMFSKFSYAKAIPLYEEMLVKDDNAFHALQRLAESYLLLRDFEKSIPYFERFIESRETPSNYYFKYGMALKSIGKEKEALHWLKRYKKLNKNDKRVKQFLKDGNLASVVFNSRERYEVEPVHFNSEYNDFGAIEFNGRIYFSSSRSTKEKANLYEWDNQPWLDIYYIEEDNDAFSGRMSDFGVMPFDDAINSEYHESSLAFSTDYKNDTIIYFTRNNYFQNKTGFYEIKHKEEKLVEKRNNLKIYKAEKVDGNWEVTRNLKLNADHYSTGHPSVNPNRTKLYFASDRPGGYGGTDIYYCDIHPRGGVGKAVNAGPIVNTAGNEMFPFVNNEGKLFFSSDGHVGFGQLDVFATVTNEEDAIVDIINLGKPINSEKDDFAFYSNEDGTKGYISSNRKGGKGGDDIYRFDFTPSLYLEGYVYDAVNDLPLDSVLIQLTKDNGDTFIKETTTDKNGYYRMFVNRNMDYTLSLTRRTHPNKMVDLSTFNLPRTQKKVVRDIYMEPVMDVKVLAGLNKIYFDFDKSNIRPDAARELDKVVNLMLVTYPYMTIKLEAHTDPVGSHQYNDKLSEARAKSTYDYLIKNGISKERILSYKGFGKRRPVNNCKTKWDCPAKVLELNRRTEFPIINILGPESKKALVLNKSK